MDWTKILADAGVPEPPGRQEVIEQMQLFPATGKQRKQDGMEQVLANAGPDFKRRVLAVILAEFRKRTVLASEITTRCRELGIEPHHPNAWGSVYSTLAKQRPDLMTHLRSTAKSQSPNNNDHEYRQWRIN